MEDQFIYSDDITAKTKILYLSISNFYPRVAREKTWLHQCIITYSGRDSIYK